MSRLHVYYGDGPSTSTAVAKPGVLSYEDHADHWRRFRNEPVARAAALRRNDCCPRCRRPMVEPLELNDGICGRNNRPIPGTATLVGFHCQNCDWEWPA